MKRTLVIGGGLAGLTASFYLSKKSHVTLLEASPKFGGRTYSLLNEELNDIYDNGQHIMMGCYDTTLNLIKNIGSDANIDIQKSLEISFVEENGKITKLKAPKYFYPVNQAIAMLSFKLLSFRDRMRVMDFLLDLICSKDEDLHDLTVIEWLMEKNQNDETVKKLWEVLVVGTLNATPEKASAQLFDEVLRKVFLSGSKASRMIIPKVGLSELFVTPILKYLKDSGNDFINNERLVKIIIDDNRTQRIVTNKTEYTSFDQVIMAIPPHALEKISFENLEGEVVVPDFQIAMREFNYSSILNVHLWLETNPFKEKFYALVDSDIHWLFNHDQHISLTTSAADYLIEKNNDEIIIEFYSELEKYFPIFNSKMVIAHKIIKEKRATFLPDCASYKLRKNIFSSFENMFFAGDWTDTNLPATIEGAILSGKLAADRVISK
jgi:hydroxysqualene dehydroxylase